MTFFNSNTPIFVRKKTAFVQDLPGIWRIHWQIGRHVILSTFYTRHDQACLVWGLLSSIIFTTVQFVPVSWLHQTVIFSGLTLAALAIMLGLTLYLTEEKPFARVLWAWVLLMVVGISITNMSFFLGWGHVLGSICPLWLILNAIGYCFTGVELRSRMFLLLSGFHLLAVLLLPYVGIWQPLTTGIVISGCAFWVAELQWDANGVCLSQLQPAPQ
ncbi:hypothetical protein H6G89_22360 [Oscillatoria sp. FACHB-1407]|nr:hypothetical protein [Oscillatoria sp. FACHB-1407]